MSKEKPVVLGIEDYKRFMKQQAAASQRVFRYRPITEEQRKANIKRDRLRTIRRVAKFGASK